MNVEALLADLADASNNVEFANDHKFLKFSLLNPTIYAQSYKASMLVNYDSRVISISNFLAITSLEL